MVNRVNKWVLAIAIAIVLNLFVNYGVATFYKGPDYSDFCKEQFIEPRPLKYIGTPEFEKNCAPLEMNKSMHESCGERKGYIAYHYNATGCPTDEYCETCQAEHDKVRKMHDGNVFAFLIIMAVIALGAGLLSKAEAVSAGLLLGGVLGLIIASIRYWEHLQNVYRFLLLGLVLAILLWLGYKKVK